MQENNVAETVLRDAVREFEQFITQPNALRSVLILFVSLILAYWLSSFLAKGIIKLAQATARRSDSSTDDLHQWKLRRIETYLSITVAVVRVLVVAVVAFYAWQFLSPAANTSVAAIGAGAFFIVLAGGTIGVMLRDLTSGTAMIAEQWFNVGDHIKVEPFIDVNGVVERATLRSTKLRSLSGEVIWLHNQYIHGVRVTPKGVRTIAIDLFVNDEERGKELASKVIETIPVGTLLIAKKPTIQNIDKWGDNLWRIIIHGYTAPGREWLMEQLFVDMIKSTDKKAKSKSVLVYPPIVRHADPEAERNFKRAIKIK
jgi:moderate conductance mechanosensitive channel